MKKGLVLILGVMATIAVIVSAVYVARLPPAPPEPESLEGRDFDAERRKAEDDYHETIDRLESLKSAAYQKKRREAASDE